MAAGSHFRVNQKAPLMLIDLGDLKGNDLTGIAVCASYRETTWEDDPVPSSGQRLFERLIDGMQLTAGGQAGASPEAAARRMPTSNGAGCRSIPLRTDTAVSGQRRPAGTGERWPESPPAMPGYRAS